MKRKSLLGILLLILLLLAGNIFGMEIPGINFNSNNNSVVITGYVQPLADVNIVISKEGKRYFLDTIVAELDGTYQFTTKLPSNQLFDVILSSQDEAITFQLETTQEELVVDKDKLQTLITEAKQKDSAKYTQESWKSLERALIEAEKIYINNDSSQQRVDEAVIKLENALKALVPINSGGGSGGGTTPQEQYVTLSIDKLAINKGYVVSPTKVTFNQGETAWDILKRELDQRGISYDYTFSDLYGSVYVESIDGDGEFDHGPGSGWMYNVNGYYPEYGASLYVVHEGDAIEWRYTKNLGDDLGSNAGGSTSETLPGHQIEVPNMAESKVEVPKQNNQVFYIDLTQALNQVQSLEVSIPESNSKVFLNIGEVKKQLPTIDVHRASLRLHINKGTSILSDINQIELFNPESIEKIQSILTKEKLSAVSYYIMHSKEEMITFSEPVTITIEKGSTQKVAWLIEGELRSIPIYDTEAEAKKAVQEKGLESYGYKDGANLILSSKVLGSIITYTSTQEQSVTYKDFEKVSDWAKEAVIWGTQKGIIEGYEGYFEPKEAVTRAAFTKMLLHTIYGADIHADQAAPFSDVNEEDWFKVYIDMAYEKGIVQGYGEVFKPNEKISREQMAVMLVRALALEKQNDSIDIKDFENISDWAQEDVLTAYSYGLIKGVEGSFLPQEQATREMAVVVMMRGYTE